MRELCCAPFQRSWRQGMNDSQPYPQPGVMSNIIGFPDGAAGAGESGEEKEQGCQFFCLQSFSNAEAKRSPRTRTPCVPRWTVSVG